MKSLKKVLLAAFILALTLSFPLMSTKTEAQTPVLKTVEATLTWNANTEADLAGYRVYRGQGATTCDNSASLLTQLTTGTGAPVTVLPTATPTYVDSTFQSIDSKVCYEVTAIDTAGNESPKSNRAIAVVNVNPPSAPQSLNLKVVIK